MKNYLWGRDLDHAQIIKDLESTGTASTRFFFFVMISSSIAMFGLLLNSAPVVIGAMLLSPLMGPIVLQGFSMGVVDFPLLVRSSLCIGVGIVVSIWISAGIVLLSPLVDVTPEILSRTNPNLFDLVIAVMSGVAAGYVFVHQKGSELVGAALATSLMPPLAVIGFGLATGSFWIAKGAFLLFMTNMLAISISIYAVSKVYGFKHKGEKKVNLLSVLVAVSILVVLSIPLTMSLKNIVYQSYITKSSKSLIQKEFEGPNFRLSDFDIVFAPDEVTITAVVITKHYRPKAKEVLLKKLKDLISEPLKFTLTQVSLVHGEKNTDSPSILKAPTDISTFKNYSANKDTSAEDALKIKIRAETSLEFQDISVNPESALATLKVSENQKGSILFFHQEEVRLDALFPKWTLILIPPHHSLLPFYFDSEVQTLTSRQLTQAEILIWALKRWQCSSVEIVLYRDEHSILKDDTALQAQASALMTLLTKDGFAVSIVTQLTNASPQAFSHKKKPLNRIDVIPVFIAED